MYARQTRIFSRAEYDSVTLLVCINLTLLERKSCSVHMTVLENVVHQLDTIMGMMYLGADNSSVDWHWQFINIRNCMICFDVT